MPLHYSLISLVFFLFFFNVNERDLSQHSMPSRFLVLPRNSTRWGVLHPLVKWSVLRTEEQMWQLLDSLQHGKSHGSWPMCECFGSCSNALEHKSRTIVWMWLGLWVKRWGNEVKIIILLFYCCYNYTAVLNRFIPYTAVHFIYQNKKVIILILCKNAGCRICETSLNWYIWRV